MIVVQSPLRVSLFGGGTDFPAFFSAEGGCVLTSAIDKYIFVTVKKRFDQKLRVGYTRTELVDSLDEVKHELIREALRKVGITEGVEVTTMGDIPSAGSGLGSSSTVTVGTLRALYALLGEIVPAERLAREACEIEIATLRKPIGIQDQYIAAFGGLRFMEFRPSGRVRLERIALDPAIERRLYGNLLLFFTGVTRTSDTILSEQTTKIPDRMLVLGEMRDIAYEARDELVKGNLDALGHLFDQAWQMKKQLASRISNGEIDEMYTAARRAGALGGKISGAGGGGFLLLYCPHERQDAVRAALYHLQELPFKLERDGAKAIFNYERASSGIPMAIQENGDQIDLRRSSFLGWSLIEGSGNGRSTREGEQPSVRDYISDIQNTLDELPLGDIAETIELLHEARFNQRQVFIMGNGGSASTASHFVCDLSKNTRTEGWPHFRAIALTDNMATFSAYANDEGYRSVFAGQLANLVRPGDIVIGISTSGNSGNVLEAIQLATRLGATTIGFTGFDGGQLGQMVDLHVHVPSDCIEQVEDVHLMLEHMVTKTLRELAIQASTSEQPMTSASVNPEAGTGTGEDVLERGGPETLASPFTPNRSWVELLYAINRELTRQRDLAELLRRLLQLTFDMIGVTSGSLLVLNQDGRVIDGAVGYSGKLIDVLPERLAEVLQRGLAGWVVKHRKGVLVESTRDDPRWLRRTWDEDRDGSRSAISVPLLIRGQAVGVLTLVQRQKDKFTVNDLAMLSTIAACVSIHGTKYNAGHYESKLASRDLEVDQT